MSLKFHPKIHSELINLCTNGGTMENCSEFQEISSLLNTANDFVKDFSKIRFKGGKYCSLNSPLQSFSNFRVFQVMNYISRRYRPVLVVI